MAGFLYHIPNERQPTPEALEAVGFTMAAEAALPGGACDQGPSGPGGCVFTVRTRNTPNVGYWPDRQTWRQFGGYWVGHEDDSPPTPGDLLREDAIDGHPVKLGDGNEWTIPTVRRLDGRLLVPCAYGMATDNGVDPIKLGELVPLPAYAALVELVREAWDQCDTEGASMDEARALSLGVKALALNYTITPVEIDFLRLLNTTNLEDVIISTFDYHTIASMTAALQNAGAA